MTARFSLPAILLSSLLPLNLLPANAESITGEGLPAFLDAHCVTCHNPDKKKGKLDLSPVLASPGNTDSATLLLMLDVLAAGDMPPEDEPQPAEDELVVATHALDDLLKVIAADPAHGNLIDHKKLFTEPEVRRASTPARLWRLSPHIFMQYANGLARSALMNTDGGREGGDGLHPAFAYMTPAHSFRDHAASHLFEDATSELLFDVCWQVAGMQISGKGKKAMEKSFRAISSQQPSSQLWNDAIQTQFALALRRRANEVELAELIAVAEKTLAETDKPTAIQAVLAAILLRPDAVYRFEVGRDGTPDDQGRVRLSDYELAHALVFALTDVSPAQALQTAMNNDGLADTDAVRTHVERLLADPASEPRLIRFFQEYFEYPRVVEVFKDDSHPNYTRPDQRIADADELIAWILESDQDVLRRLLTEDKLFIIGDGGNGTKSFEKMARKYYLPDFGIDENWDWKGAQPVKPTIGRRSGILTHPVWLLTFSDNEKNQAIQRGHWIYTKLLGGNIPDTPIGVDAVLPEDPHKTLRERMSVTREEYCWRCHSRMDPLGLPLEQFDDFGRWRELEKDRPLDTTGEIDIGDPELDGPVGDPFEMLERLAASERVEQVFTRHAFRYFLGRNETVDDAPTLIDAHRAYRDNGGSFRALVTSLLTSDSFLLRKS